MARSKSTETSSEQEQQQAKPEGPAPTLGRIVHARIHGIVRAGVVSGLHEDGAVDVTIMTNHRQDPTQVQERLQLIDPAGDDAHGWYWPPRS